MDMQDMNVRALLELTASDAPAPGGGAIAALSGAFGAALAAMVGSLTLGKKGYESVQEEMAETTAKANALAQKLLSAMDEDANSFNGYMAALKMPKDTEDEKAARRAAMQESLKSASLVPLNTAKTAADIFPLAEAAVNLGSIKDEAFVSELRETCAALQAEALAAEQRILDLAPELK